jgi:type I restriction-modification system DNA methylase subunit
MSVVSEANIHVELYRVLKNLIVSGKGKFKALEFTDVKSELNVDGGRADLVIFGKEDGLVKPFVVIETKRKTNVGVQRNFDPYSPKVIDQAAFYAMKIGANYFITTNGQVLVSFETFKTGIPLPERRVKPYDLRMRITEEAITRVLEDLAKIHIGIEKWLLLDEVFVNRLHTFHQFITPFVERALKYKLLDIDFRKRFEDWLRSQFFDVSEEIKKQIASQAAYVLMNRILFYKTLEAHRTDLPILHKIDYSSGGEFTVKLREYFKRILDINYKAIFEEGILNEIPIPNPLAETLNDFIEELDTYNLAEIRSDVIGRVYEDLIPEDERHKLGQYYTPPPIVDLIVEMTVKNPNDTVIDPGCGSGSFLVKAYTKLKELKLKENPLQQPEVLHEDVLDQLWGIDINQFPAHLASINLAVRNLDVLSRNIQIAVSDFFKVNPTFIKNESGTLMIGLTETTTLDGKSLGQLPPYGFDVVNANPPYTRQEEMEYKERIRDVALTYSDGSKIKLGARAGIYAYFFTHSAKFLKNRGKMGYITSDTWLDVGFGRDLKKFFLEYFKIEAIIWYDVRAFTNALVGTCVIVLKKHEGIEFQANRDENTVKFVRIKKPMPIQDVVKIIETNNTNFENDGIGIACIKQRQLLPKDKWGKYLRAPNIYYRIIQNPQMTKLGNIAKIKRGLTTGANKFFYIDNEKAKVWGIEKEYLKPVIISPKGIKLDIKPEDISEYVLMVNEPKSVLKKKNANVLKYIEHGEIVETKIKGGVRGGSTVKGYQNLSTLKSRKIWYNLGERNPAPLLFSCKIWEDCRFPVNKAKALANKAFYEIYPIQEENTTVLAGLLNSSITALIAELHGRFYGGGVLELEVYETNEVPVIDPSKLSEDERMKIEELFAALCEVKRKENSKLEEKERQKIDKVVFEILGLTETEKKQVYKSLDSLRNIRLRRKKVKVLVETEEQWKLPDRLKTGERKTIDSTKRLDKWV